jgi:excisionase family DNA binding protein
LSIDATAHVTRGDRLMAHKPGAWSYSSTGHCPASGRSPQHDGPGLALASRPDHDPEAGTSAGAVLELAARDDFQRWEAQLAATGHCAAPVRLQGRIEAIDLATGQARVVYDTDTEPGGVLRIPCGNRREHACPACSQVYKNDARQIIRSGLTGGKGIPAAVAAHSCVFATLTAPGFGPVHTTRFDRRGRSLPCRPRRDTSRRRCPHGREISCSRVHRDDDPRLGQPMCPDCYDYTGHVLFNACSPDLRRRFIIYLPRHLARLAGITQKAVRAEVSVRFVKVAEYQARGVVHYHAIIRLDAPGLDHQPPPARYTAALLADAIRAAAAAVSIDTAGHLTRLNLKAAGTGDTAAVPVVGAGLARTLRFGSQIDARTVRAGADLPGTGSELSALAVANYIAKYATKTISATGLPDRPVRGAAAIAALRCAAHYKRLISVCWELSKQPATAQLGLNRWTHMLGYRGHFLTKSQRYSTTFTRLRHDRITYRRAQRHPDGDKDPWSRDLDERTVQVISAWHYAGTGHATAAERQLASPLLPAPASATASPARNSCPPDPSANERNPSTMEQLLYRPKRAAQVLGISRDKLYDLIRAGRITSVKDDRARFITADALAVYVGQLEAEASQAA